MSCKGMTFRMPCRTSTVFGISIFSASVELNSWSLGLQITMGLPPRAMTMVLSAGCG